MLRGLCTFTVHPTWQKQGFGIILSIGHFGEFLGKFACPDLSFLSILQHFLPQTFNLQKMPIFMLRGLCTFSMHPSWQEQGYAKILSTDHFGEFLEKFACPDLSFLSIFQHFLPQTFNLQKIPIFMLWGLCTFTVHSTWQEQGFGKILSIGHFGEYLEKFACPDLSFLSIFQHFLPQTFNLQKIPIFMLRGLCTFTVHSTWQEQGFGKILSIGHFGEFLGKFACPDLSFLLTLYVGMARTRAYCVYRASVTLAMQLVFICMYKTESEEHVSMMQRFRKGMQLSLCNIHCPCFFAFSWSS